MRLLLEQQKLLIELGCFGWASRQRDSARVTQQPRSWTLRMSLQLRWSLTPGALYLWLAKVLEKLPRLLDS